MDEKQYLVMVGIRAAEFTYQEEQLLNNIGYFLRCRLDGLSPYKALLYFHDWETTQRDLYL